MSEPIKKPGIYDIPADEYHKDCCPEPSLSASVAWTLLSRSPSHAWVKHPRLNSELEREDKAIFDLGSAAHNMVLRQDFWREEIDIIDSKDWRKSDARQARHESREAGRYPILRDQYTDLERMVTVIESHPEASNAFRDGQPEKTLAWQDRDTGIWLRIRPDWMPNIATNPYPDYKTTADALAWDRRFLNDHGGLVRAAFYEEGVRVLTSTARPTMYYVVQEVTPPFAIVIRVMPPELLEIGRRMLRKAKAFWAECLDTGRWPSYELIGTLSLSKWAQEQFELDYADWGDTPKDKPEKYEPHEVLGR